MPELVYIAMITFPSLALMWIFLKPNVGLILLVFAAVLFPVAAIVWTPSFDDESEVVVVDPAAEWGESECYGKDGIVLLMRDLRDDAQPQWWVKCGDGSKSAAVAPEEFAWPTDEYRPSEDHSVI